MIVFLHPRNHILILAFFGALALNAAEFLLIVFSFVVGGRGSALPASSTPLSETEYHQSILSFKA